MKLPKFLLCENPIITGDHSGRVFILHTGSQKMLAEVTSFEDMGEEDRLNIERQLDTYGRLDYPPETFFFIPVWGEHGYEIIPDKEDQQTTADKLDAIMRRMADWYKSYLIWEDQQSVFPIEGEVKI